MLRDLGAKMANKSATVRPLGGSSEAGWRVWGSLGEPGEAGTGEDPQCRALVRLGEVARSEPTVLEDRILEDSIKDIGGSKAQGLET